MKKLRKLHKQVGDQLDKMDENLNNAAEFAQASGFIRPGGLVPVQSNGLIAIFD